MTSTPDNHAASREGLRRFVEQWRRLGPILERIEAESLRTEDQSRAAALLSLEVDRLRCVDPPGPTSGMIDMQRHFMRLAARQRNGRTRAGRR